MNIFIKEESSLPIYEQIVSAVKNSILNHELAPFLKEESSLPIYEQIVSAVKNSILNHELAPGDMLPSIRSLAKSLGISVITTKRAYEELEKQGLIYSEQAGTDLFRTGKRLFCQSV